MRESWEKRLKKLGWHTNPYRRWLPPGVKFNGPHIDEDSWGYTLREAIVRAGLTMQG